MTVSARDENSGEEITIQLPIVRGSAGAPAVDISTLPAATGLYTLDPGFVATGSCRSAITFIDGPAGVLLHRGYGIDDLAAKSSYLEVVYLLLNNRLPPQRRLDLFTEEVIRRMSVDRRLESTHEWLPGRRAPDGVMVCTVGALSAFYHDCRVKAMNESESARRRARRREAADDRGDGVPAPRAYRTPRRGGQVLAANLLNMCFASPLDGGEFVAPAPLLRRLLMCSCCCTRTTSRTRQPQQCAWRSSEANRLRAWPRASRVCGGPCTAARTRLYPHAARDREQGRIPEFLARPRTRTTRSSSWALAIESTGTSTRGRRR